MTFAVRKHGMRHKQNTNNMLYILGDSGSHLVRHPGAVCKLVAVGDGDDHRRLEEERVTALKENITRSN